MPEEIGLAPAGQIQGVQLEGPQHVPEQQLHIENGQLAKENGPTMGGREQGNLAVGAQVNYVNLQEQCQFPPLWTQQSNKKPSIEKKNCLERIFDFL